MQLIMRVFVDGKLQTVERLTGDSLSERLASFASRYADQPHMIEFEFPDAPLEERFLRVGTDPRYMVDPCAIDIEISDHKLTIDAEKKARTD